MNFRDLNVRNSYISKGPDNFANSLLLPALKQSKVYKRSVGYFSSSGFEIIADGLARMADKGGEIQLIASPNLSKEDIEAIDLGYKERDKVIAEAFSREFEDALKGLSDDNLELLAQMIALRILDVKIAVTTSNGMYHDKLGILEDRDGNTIVFYGSANATHYGYDDNYEKVRVVTSWNVGQYDSVMDEIREFDSLWNKTNPYVDVYDYTESAQQNVLKIRSEKKKRAAEAPVVLRNYQEEAIEAWTANGYKGFLVMATGTGKTWTALFAAHELAKKETITIVITAPYKHLVRQWSEDVADLFKNSAIIMVSSENPNWEESLRTEIVSRKYGSGKQLIVISTIASFYKERFVNAIEKDKNKKLLIVDEAHRFTERTDKIKEQYQYLLGLSATPYKGTSPQSGIELMDYFGGRVYNLPIEDALRRKCLVGYYYKPIYVYATASEEDDFNYHTSVMASCFVNNICVDIEKLARAKRNRLRVISMSEDKQSKLKDIISQLRDKERDHLIVYCGDGKLFDEDAQKEIRHINSVKQILNSLRYKASQFTAKENINERMTRVDSFNKGTITALAAIRCLDEGINIPSIKSALILSSNDDYREFVQRRGRILRTYPGKEYATIYDVIVLPGTYMTAWAKIEFRRFNEYAKLAINAKELDKELEQHLHDYSIEREDINVFEFDAEETLDE